VRAVLQRHSAQAGLKILVSQLGVNGQHMRQRAHRDTVFEGKFLAVQLLRGRPVAKRLKVVDPQGVRAQRGNKMVDV